MKKRWFPAAAALLCLLIALTALPARAESPDSAGQLLQIQEASYDPETGLLSVRWISEGAPPVTEAEFRVSPLDAAGSPMVIGEGYIEEILLEERMLHVSFTAEAGQSVSASFQVGDNYPGAADVWIAADRVVRTSYAEDGTLQERIVQELPDNRLCWFSAGQNAYISGPDSSDPYEIPPEDALAASAEVHLGFSAVPVPAELADAYGFAFSGMMIVSVEEGSAADEIGLEPGDLIYSVNDRPYFAEPYCIALGLQDLAAGHPVTIRFERDNTFWEVSLKNANE